MPEAPIGKDSAIIVMEIDTDGAVAVMGALVDSVAEVVELPVESIEPPPRFGSGLSVDCILGVGKRDDGFLILVDMDWIFQADERRLIRNELEPAMTAAD